MPRFFSYKWLFLSLLNSQKLQNAKTVSKEQYCGWVCSDKEIKQLSIIYWKPQWQPAFLCVYLSLGQVGGWVKQMDNEEKEREKDATDHFFCTHPTQLTRLSKLCEENMLFQLHTYLVLKFITFEEKKS